MASRFEIVASMKAQPGLRAIRILPDGRFGFAVNRATDTVYIFDVSTNRLAPCGAGGAGARTKLPSPDNLLMCARLAASSSP